MGQKRKHKDAIPADYTFWRINTAPIESVWKIGKLVASSDYFISYYKNRKHPQYYKNEDGVRYAVRRAFAQGAFNHREQIGASLYDDISYLQFAETQPDKRRARLLELKKEWSANPCLVCTRSYICDEATKSRCPARWNVEDN